ncbi:hypothetical protein RDWZM_009420 [Blomia tropicalis]|uniref:Biogenesis of lysosome-related organelles complex 1 subunit 2 n=1 Tax=Blomia tropicalis TaxID=40697 RepID=A0A9Q0M426_BLOTA|nr:hypothetical protein RDWZM_009420 [Blomia tropicalis]
MDHLKDGTFKDENVKNENPILHNNDNTIDIGVEATTLPPISSKDRVLATADDMFQNLHNYITSEFELTLDDYKLLESMNNVTIEKYHDISSIAENITNGIEDLNKKYEQMLPKLEIIDKLDRKVSHLEKLTYAIDAYSKRLGKKAIQTTGETDRKPEAK